MLRKVDKTIRLPGVSRSSLNGTKISYRSLSSVISSWKNWEGQQTEQKQANTAKEAALVQGVEEVRSRREERSPTAKNVNVCPLHLLQ